MTTAPANDELLVGFVEESLDSLQSLADQLDAFRLAPEDSGSINAVFRSVHSIKGNAGFFGLAAIKKFSHVAENTLDEIRQGKRSLSEELQRSLVLTFDSLGEMLQNVLTGEIQDDLTFSQFDLLQRISQPEDKPGEEIPEKILRELIAEMSSAADPQAAKWADKLKKLVGQPAAEEECEATPAPAAPTDSFRPSDLNGAVCKLAEKDCTALVAATLDIFQAVEEGRYTRSLGGDFLASLERFAQFAEECKVQELAAALNAAAADFKTLWNSPLDIDAVLLTIVWDRLREEYRRFLPQTPAKAPAAPSPAANEHPAEAKHPAKEQAHAHAAQRMLRVKEESIDQFLDDVSKLFITCERFKDLAARMGAHGSRDPLLEEFRQVNLALNEQTNSLQESVVTLRMVPAAGLLSKFPRMARTLAENLGKKLDVHLSGADLQIDKSLSEDLDSPLTHMVRNVCDHAIELPADRVASGKSETGRLDLGCEVTRTHVVFTIQDDGRGIDPARLRRKVVEKEIMSEAQAATLSDAEATDLIFHPGFSTAEQISEISGRGVGLDVVRTKLREHGGDVEVESRLGAGTIFRLRIPLRKAVVVIDGLLVKAADGTFVLPFEHIHEIVSLDHSIVNTVRGKPVVTIRNTPFAAVDVAELLEITPPRAEWKGCTGVLVGSAQGRICLTVDRVIGQRKVVINELHGIIPCRETMGGVAQLGGGKLAIVLSAPDIIRAVAAQAAQGSTAL